MLPSDIVQRQLRLPAKVQVPNRRPHGFQRRDTTAGLKPQNSVLSRKRRTRRGRKQYPRKSNLMFGYVLSACHPCSRRSWFWSDATPGRTPPSGREVRP